MAIKNILDIVAFDDDLESITDSIDFSSIAAHPRLFLKSGDISNIISLVGSDTKIATFHAKIMAIADAALTADNITYKLDESGTRILQYTATPLAQRLTSLAYAYKYTGTATYATRAVTEMLNACAYPDWHTSHMLDTATILTGFSICYDWLYSAIGATDRTTIETTVFKYALNLIYSNSVSDYSTNQTNWNQVCSCGIGLASIAFYNVNTTICGYFLNKLLHTLRIPAGFYEPDGTYREGPGYWSFGTNQHLLLLQGLESAFGTDFYLSDFTGLQKTWKYKLFTYSPTNKGFNYGDSSEGFTDVNPALFYYAIKNADTSVLYLQIKFLANGYDTYEPYARFMIPLLATKLNYSNVTTPKNVFYGSGETPVIIARMGWDSDQDHYLGFKGGKCNQSHAHMDIGTFVYESKGIRWACDLGSEPYTNSENGGINSSDNTQYSNKWQVYRNSIKPHNILQLDGANLLVDGFSDIVKVNKLTNKAGGVIDLTAPNANKLKFYTREINIIDGSYLQIIDTIIVGSTDVSARWNMSTYGSGVVNGDGSITLTSGSNTAILATSFSNAKAYTARVLSNEGTNSYDSSNTTTKKVCFDFTLNKNESIVITTTIKPQ
ncbi:heparinase II/III domain-containing protein [Rhizosphaericola mali]|uniref:Heparinase n=1 Tax=Rhizosphaericola mali TaxID=2545455 RepID=A0A5P2G114_9BACT|nr:heparinase II/III family protein [Rhizosphaericola mali]QES88877.1 hypothetical protein E0W69_009485 [Rhizosphaericola mali]